MTFDDPAPELAETPNEMALAQYYESLDKAEVDDIFISDRFNSLFAEAWKRWTPEQRGYVLRNTNRRDIPPEIMGLLQRHANGPWARRQASRDEREAHRRQIRQGRAQPAPFGVGNFTVGEAIGAGQDFLGGVFDFVGAGR